MTTVAVLTLQQMLSEMDIALADEIKEQRSKKSAAYIAVDGKLIVEESGQLVYIFSLKDSWELADDTPIRVKISGAPSVKGTIVTSNGTTITLATKEALSPEALRQIEIINDSTELLERLREALKENDEGRGNLGSKSFGLLQSRYGEQPSPVTFGKFCPDESQRRAIAMALGSEVTYIVGPPGTGKTSTLAATAFALLRKGHTVLIAAHTNIAVDNAIMKLTDIFQDTGALAELRAGLVIRYGAPQHKSLSEDDKYEDVYLPKIIRRMGYDLDRRRKALQTSLDQIIHDLGTTAQNEKQRAERWQAQRPGWSNEHDARQNELTQLAASEQQRINTLDARLRQHVEQLQRAQQTAWVIRQQLGEVASQQVQYQRARTEHLAEVSSLIGNLAQAHRMNPVKRFFRGIDLKSLEQQLVHAKQRVWQDEQILTDLQKRMHIFHGHYAAVVKQIEEFTTTYHGVMAQRNVPSAAAAKIASLRTLVAQYDQAIAHGDAELQRERTGMQQKRKVQSNEIVRLKEQIAAIDKQMADLEKSIVAQARVVATTLSKTYTNQNVSTRRFDVVILDEVSMAPLPSVYVAASHADHSLVALGDPCQLAPIVMAKTSRAAEWLGRDLFDLRAISLEGADGNYRNSALLKEQARMHPGISIIARTHVYRGLMRDSDRLMSETRQAYANLAPFPGKPLLLCDTSDAMPLTVRPESGSRINIYHALCTLTIARQALASLPTSSEQQGNSPRIGLVTPYRKQAELLQHLIQDAGLKDFVRAGTVHRFQGLEFDVVIFDTVESPPLVPREGFIAGQWGTEAMRLVNVAVTRPKHKLIMVANAHHIRARFSEQDILRLAMQEAQEAGCIASRDILGFSISAVTLSATSQHALQNDTRGTLPSTSRYEPELLDDRTFFNRFFADVGGAVKRVVIYSPFLGSQRTKALLPALAERCKAGVRITVVASQDRERNPTMSEPGRLLKDAGVELRTLSDMHQKLVFIDEDIVYTGSLNVLSHTSTTEFMERTKSPRFAKKVWQFMDVDTVVQSPVKWGEEIVISYQKLPRVACECGNSMRAKTGRLGVFYGCESYPSCKKTENVSEKHLSDMQQLTHVACSNCECGIPMQVRTHRKDVWLECAAQVPCGYRRRLSIK